MFAKGDFGLLQPLVIMVTVALAASLCRSAGLLFARVARIAMPWPLSFLCGAALLSLAMLGMGLAKLYQASALLPCAAALLLLGHRIGALARPMAVPRPPWWMAVILGSYTVLYLANAMAPEVSPDGVAYHVDLPQRYWAAGGVVPILTSIYAQMPQGLEMLFVLVVPPAGPSAAALFHLLFLFVLASLMYQLTSSWLPVALVFCSPVVGIDAASAYNDVALAAAALGAFAAVERWRQEQATGWLAAASLLAGFSFSLKYTGGLVFVLVLARAASAWRTLALWLPAAALALPWLVKNALFTGNPVAPFGSAQFQHPVFDLALETQYLEALRWPGTLSALALEVTARGQETSGLLGPIFLLSPLALLAVRRTPSRAWLAAALWMTVPFAFNSGTRFLIPALPFLAMAWTAVLPRPAAVALVAVHALLSSPAALDRYTPTWAWRLREFPVAAALRWETERQFLDRRLDGWQAVEALTPGPERVLTLSQFHDAYIPRPVLNATASREGRDLGMALWIAASPAKLTLSRLRYWFPTQQLAAIRLRKEQGDPLSIARITPYHLLQALSPANARWRAQADWNSYFAHRVLDGSLFTLWHSSTRPDQPVSLSVEFDQALSLNRVDVDLASTEHLPPMRLEGRTPDGTWIVLREQWEQAADPPPPADPRAEALGILHRHGVAYVLIQSRDHRHAVRSFDEPFQTGGFLYERVRDAGPAKLYRIHPLPRQTTRAER